MAMLLQVCRYFSFKRLAYSPGSVQMTTFLEQYLHAKAHEVAKSPDAIRLGILSTANINSAAVINPAKSHGGVIVSAIASRDLKPAQEHAKKYGIPKAYGSYEELLNEPGIDAVYISLPNGMHGGTYGLRSYVIL